MTLARTYGLSSPDGGKPHSLYRVGMFGFLRRIRCFGKDDLVGVTDSDMEIFKELAYNYWRCGGPSPSNNVDDVTKVIKCSVFSMDCF